MSSRTKVWFGNLSKAYWMPAPSAGMEGTSRGRIEKVDLANGGSFVSQSLATHREYDMEWRSVEHDDLKTMYDFRNGLFGAGLMYFCDPWVNNALAPHWAEPALSGADWPSLYSAGQAPTVIPAGGVVTNLVRDPNTTSHATNWAISGASPSIVGGKYRMTTVSAGPIAYPTSGEVGDPYFAYTIGTQIAYRAEFTNPNAYSVWVKLGVNGYNSGGAWLGETGVTLYQILPGQTTVIETLGTIGIAGTVKLLPVIYLYGDAGAGNPSVGTMLDFTRVALYLGTTAPTASPVPPMDGSTKFLDGRVSTWNGAPNDSTSTGAVAYIGMPQNSAVYTISTPLTSGAYPRRSQVLLIPPTQTLWVGFSGSAVGDAGVYVQPVGLDGSLPVPTKLTLLPPGGSTRLNASFSGATYSAVIIYLDTSTLASTTITLNSGKAIYATTGTTPTLTGVHERGEGHTGMRFQSDITRVYQNERGTDGVQLISAAVSLTEVGAWA